MKNKLKQIKLASSKELDLKKTFECGQCFRWNADNKGVYRGIACGYPAIVWEEDGNIYLKSNAPEEFWHRYFDLDLDYEKISEPFFLVPYLEECTRKGMGIRILNQEPWETMCSFLISQCNNIKRIQRIVERLCEKFGDAVYLGGEKFYTFPSYEVIAQLEIADLDSIKAGYRAQYLLDAARALENKSVNLEDLISLPYEDAKKQLLKINGIGEKVANCIILFGLHNLKAFPVDVWIKRAMEEYFPPSFNPEELGTYAGLAQQYIFYNMRLK